MQQAIPSKLLIEINFITLIRKNREMEIIIFLLNEEFSSTINAFMGIPKKIRNDFAKKYPRPFV